jgi:hypothetical protein
MLFLKLFEVSLNPEDEEWEPMFSASTKGGKYMLTVEKHKARDEYRIGDFTSGRLTGRAYGVQGDIVQRICKVMVNAAHIDGINYAITFDNLGVEQELPKHKFNPHIVVHPNVGKPFLLGPSADRAERN